MAEPRPPAAPGPPGGGLPPRRPGAVQPLRAAAVIVVAVVVAVVVLARMGQPTTAVASKRPSSSTRAPTTTTAPAASTSVPATSTSAATTTTTTTVAPSSVTVLVLNGWTTPHAALYFKNKLASFGYDTRAPANAISDTNTTSQVFVVQPAYRANALAIAAAVHLPASAVVAPNKVNDVAVPTADLTGTDIVLLVGKDISSQVPAGYTGSG
jgi:hypothetical protein